MAAVEYKIVCLNRWLGRCHDYKEDYDLNHHPNNFDCSSYKPIQVIYFYVQKKGELNTKLTKTKEAKQPELEESVVAE